MFWFLNICSISCILCSISSIMCSIFCYICLVFCILCSVICICISYYVFCVPSSLTLTFVPYSMFCVPFCVPFVLYFVTGFLFPGRACGLPDDVEGVGGHLCQAHCQAPSLRCHRGQHLSGGWGDCLKSILMLDLSSFFLGRVFSSTTPVQYCSPGSPQY